MKDKLIQIRADEELLAKIEYLQKIYGLKTLSATIRFVIDKEYRKEQCSLDKIYTVDDL